MNSRPLPRIAWLVPISEFYWQHALSSLAKIYPQTKLFTARWPGYAKGYENSIEYEVVGSARPINKGETDRGYSELIKLVSPDIVPRLLDYNPDVVFSVTFGIWTLLALLFKAVGRWQVIISYEGSAPRVDYRNSPLRLTLRRFMVKAADGCITNSQAGKDYLVQVLHASPQQVFVSPHEVPDLASILSRETAADSERSPDQPTRFIFIGQVIPRKGLHYLLAACDILRQKGVDNFEVFVIGGGSEQAKLEQTCVEKALDSHIHWIGKVPYDELGQYLLESDIFILPTLEDTWGMVVLEAMAMGKTILCSKYAGAVEMVADGENGYRFDPYDVDRLAELMEYLIGKPELLSGMGQKSQHIMSGHTPDKAAESLVEVISATMQNRATAAAR